MGEEREVMTLIVCKIYYVKKIWEGIKVGSMGVRDYSIGLKD